jgi:hypothetical protein
MVEESVMKRELFVLAAVLFLATLALVACEDEGGPAPSPGDAAGTPSPTPGAPAASPTSATPVQGLAASVSVDKATYEPGEQVRLTLVIKNVSTETKRLSFRDGQRYEFVVTDGEGYEVWRWSADKFFIQVLGEEIIDTGQLLAYSERWNQQDEAGNQVPAGAYAVLGFTVGCLAGTDICDIDSTASFNIRDPG